ncbi:hypothetical protein R1flu_016246 [Riccia fluitans]|uniref:INO80 complex subunit B-like conserved region domain-containing protein n=1 Tax=Riccia fluitans TaxID=41844 RepID=A0ABD1YLP2_9MARC
MEDMRDLIQVPEIAKGVRRHRSDVMRRPRSAALPNFSSPGSSALKDMLLVPKEHRNSPNKEAMIPLSSTAPHVLGNSHRDYDKDDGLSAYLLGTTEKRPRERFSKYVESTSGGEDAVNRDNDMDKHGKNVSTYSRREGEKERERRPGDRDDRRDYRADGERRSGGRDDGRDYRRDDRKDDRRDDRRDSRRDDRYDGKFNRNRDGRDDKSRDDSRDRRSGDRDGNWKSSKYSRDRDHYDSDGDHGKYGRDEKKRTERSWKEIAERDRYLKDNRERGRDSFSSPTDKKGRTERESSFGPSDKNDRSDRDRSEREKSHHSGEKASTHSDNRFPTKLKVKVGGFSKVLNSEGPRSKQGAPPPGSEGKVSENYNEKRSEKQTEPSKKRRHRLILQDNSDDEDYDTRAVVIKKDTFPGSTQAAKPSSEEDAERVEDRFNRELVSPSRGKSSTPSVRKSSRIPKKKVLEDFADDIPDERMDLAEQDSPFADSVAVKSREEDEDVVKDAGASDKDASVSDELSHDVDEEEDQAPKAKRRKSQDNSSFSEKAKGPPLTARQRTMQLGKDGDSELGPSLIEFPTGLSHTTGGRRGREKLTEEERQVKKAEAARRRKQLVEKAAKEIQANAIQKILGQDSSRKKKEERLLKQRQVIEQEKKDAALEPATNSIRVTMKPEGTFVSFSQDIELPQIFSSAPPSYPPPREKCAAPACTNTYKYRDSKSRVPLCSLACYKTLQPPAVLAS